MRSDVVSQILRNVFEFSDGVPLVLWAIRHLGQTVIQMIVDQQLLCCTDCTFYCIQLLSNLRATPTVNHHRDDVLQMPIRSLEALDEIWMALMEVIVAHAASYQGGCGPVNAVCFEHRLSKGFSCTPFPLGRRFGWLWLALVAPIGCTNAPNAGTSRRVENFSQAAARSNAENVIVVSNDPAVAARNVANWKPLGARDSR